MEKKISLSFISSNIKKIPWFLGRYAFVAILILIAIDMILGAVLFYKYIYLVEKNQPQVTESPATFKKDVYQEILKDWQERSQKLQSQESPRAF